MEKEECSICFFQYDKLHKVPRVLRCGHTFCQTCLDEIKLPSKHSITCPNCRLPTENVFCTKNLPENDGVFNKDLFAVANLNSPYEAAKRLMRESETLLATADRFREYLAGLEGCDQGAEKKLMDNYEREFQKVEAVAQTIVQMVLDYKDKLQHQLTESMVKERSTINAHLKEISLKLAEVAEIRSGVAEVAADLKAVQENENEYLRLQKQKYRRMQEQELDSDEADCCALKGEKPKNFVLGGMNAEDVMKGDKKLFDRVGIQFQKGMQEVDSDSCSQSSDQIKQSPSLGESLPSDLQKVDEEVQNLEKEDKQRLGAVRSLFYALNERFEQLLRFKVFSRLRLFQTELNMAATYRVFDAFRVEERVHSMEEQLKELQAVLDLKDYFEIKRPTVVYFHEQNGHVHVSRIDLLSDALSNAQVKVVNPSALSKNFASCKAVAHPSNTALFMVDQAALHLFDNVNELLVAKPVAKQLQHTTAHAVAYNEGFVYLIGGFDPKTQRTLKQCSRYNIVTEKWQMLAPMLFEIRDAAACAINEYQIVVAGGVDSQARLTDIVQVYDIRENSWRLFETCLSVPRGLPTMVCSQKDRVMIIGGKEVSGKDSKTVEEIDFLKRNIVNLACMN